MKVADSIAECDGLHEKWQAHQAQYFSSSLADLEHRILLAEDNIKKHKPSPAPPDQSYAHRRLRFGPFPLFYRLSPLTSI